MYIYKYKFEPHNEELIKYEMACLFNKVGTKDSLISDYKINPNRSYSINYRIDAMFSGSNVDELLPQIAAAQMSYEGFKIEFIDVKSSVLQYKTRIDYCIEIADLIGGYGQMKNPNITFVITELGGVWYFGELIRNDRNFERLQHKVHTYSHSMSCELSRTIVNIACGMKTPTIIDPCCGIGTVVIEAKEMGFDIEGNELNWLVYNKACENSKNLGLEIPITRGDMHDISKHYDVSILDIPYGLMSKTTSELQTGLIAKCYDISEKLILIANEDCMPLIANTGWKIEAKIDVPKANYKFTRYVYVLVKA